MDDAHRTTRVVPRVLRWLPWLGGAVLVAGVVAVVISVFGLWNTAEPLPPTGQASPVQRPVTGKKVPLARETRRVAGRFVLTAVARRNLGEAYNLVAPQLKGGLTLAQWKKGDIPVVPYPVNLAQVAPMKVDYSYADHALLEVALLPKDGAKVDGVKLKGQLFFLELKLFGKGKNAHWLVVDWVPRGAPSIPLAGS